MKKIKYDLNLEFYKKSPDVNHWFKSINPGCCNWHLTPTCLTSLVLSNNNSLIGLAVREFISIFLANGIFFPKCFILVYIFYTFSTENKSRLKKIWSNIFSFWPYRNGKNAQKFLTYNKAGSTPDAQRRANLRNPFMYRHRLDRVR